MGKKKKSISKDLSIIICTYNEENTIEGVLTSCCEYNKESEVIVIDDGSDDGTNDILLKLKNKYPFIHERFPENKGKSSAMAHGVDMSKNNIVLFFDADVSNVLQKHFEAILHPIINGEADMVLGQPSETFIDYRVNPFKSLTGERALLKKDILPILEDMRNIHFGIETFINLYYWAHGKRIKSVLLRGLKHPIKFSKTTPIKATKEFIYEGRDIASTFFSNYNLVIHKIKQTINNTIKIERQN